jgi:hypothetical protein
MQSTLSIPRLRAALNGRVIAPDDPGYDHARTVVYGGFDRRPAVIVRVADATDVAHVVSLAHETGLELAIRSGGHSNAGHSVSDGGIVLDLGDILPAPPLPFVAAEYRGRLVVGAQLAYAGAVEDGQRAVAPFRALATPIADLVRPMAYPEIYPPEQADFHPTLIARTMFVDTVDRQVAETIVEHLQASDAAMRSVQLRVLGGAMARVPAEATAFAHRDRPIMANVAAFSQGPRTGPCAKPGSPTSPRRCARASPAHTWASSPTRGKRESARPTRSRPGTASRRSSVATTPPTCSGSTRTSHQRSRTPEHRNREPPDGWSGR